MHRMASSEAQQRIGTPIVVMSDVYNVAGSVIIIKRAISPLISSSHHARRREEAYDGVVALARIVSPWL